MIFSWILLRPPTGVTRRAKTGFLRTRPKASLLFYGPHPPLSQGVILKTKSTLLQSKEAFSKVLLGIILWQDAS